MNQNNHDFDATQQVIYAVTKQTTKMILCYSGSKYFMKGCVGVYQFSTVHSLKEKTNEAISKNLMRCLENCNLVHLE